MDSPQTNSPAHTPPVQTPVVQVIPALPKQAEVFLPNRTSPTGFSPPAHGGSWGAFFGIVIIVIVLVVGALYFWGMQLERQEARNNTDTAVPTNGEQSAE